VPALGVQKESHKLWLDRLLVVACGAVALYLALGSDSIYELLEQSAMLGAAGLLVSMACALYVPRPSQAGAVLALVSGAVLAPLFEYWGFDAPFLLATAGAALGYFVGARLPGARSAAA
jgi:Na+/proline symporter